MRDFSALSHGSEGYASTVVAFTPASHFEFTCLLKNGREVELDLSWPHHVRIVCRDTLYSLTPQTKHISALCKYCRQLPWKILYTGG